MKDFLITKFLHKTFFYSQQFKTEKAGLWIRIDSIWIRIQKFSSIWIRIRIRIYNVIESGSGSTTLEKRNNVNFPTLLESMEATVQAVCYATAKKP
jgi:hypothetical protein